MPQPPRYQRRYDFTIDRGDQTNHSALNAECDAIQQTLDAIIQNLALIQNAQGGATQAFVSSIRALLPPSGAGVQWSEVGQPNGVAPLDAAGQVPAAHLGNVPVQSVNNKTGAVQLTAADVGAAPATHTHTAAQVGAIPVTEKGQPGGVATLDANGQVPATQLQNTIPSTEKGAPNGVAALNAFKRVVTNGVIISDNGGTGVETQIYYNYQTNTLNIVTTDSNDVLVSSPLDLMITYNGIFKKVWHDGLVWSSGWFTPTRTTNHTITMAHNLGAVPRLVQLIVHDLTNNVYILHSGTNPGAYASNLEYMNPLSIRLNTTNVYLDVYVNTPLCRYWNATLSTWIAHDNCQWQVIAIK